NKINSSKHRNKLPNTSTRYKTKHPSNKLKTPTPNSTINSTDKFNPLNRKPPKSNTISTTIVSQTKYRKPHHHRRTDPSETHNPTLTLKPTKPCQNHIKTAPNYTPNSLNERE
ncbi:hypothetical protein M758_3G206300, partial [Ceratodon purpureus]